MFFLDLVKNKKKFDDFNAEEKDYYRKFKDQFGNEQAFFEVETWINLLNKLDGLKPIDEETSENDIDINI